MKKALNIVGWVVTFCVFFPIACLLYLIYDSRTVAESVSPTNKGSVIIYREEGFLDTVIYLSVRDYAKFGSEPIGLGSINGASGQNTPPRKVVWSKDGTLVAVKHDGDSLRFYDFQNHRGGYGDWKDATALLNKRGGEGPKFISEKDSFDDVARYAWWWQSYPGYKDARLLYPSPNPAR